MTKQQLQNEIDTIELKQNEATKNNSPQLWQQLAIRKNGLISLKIKYYENN